jgi:hypothetical protein
LEAFALLIAKKSTPKTASTDVKIKVVRKSNLSFLYFVSMVVRGA